MLYNMMFSFLFPLFPTHEYSSDTVPFFFHQNWLSNQFTCLQVLDFLKAKDDFISLLLKHIGTSAIMDLTLKLMTQVEGVEMRQNILNVSELISLRTF